MKGKITTMETVNEIETGMQLMEGFDADSHKVMQLLFEYMHSPKRVLPNSPSTMLRVWADFFECDWIGLIDIDEACGKWSVKCFFNRRTESFSETSINKFGENLLNVPHWIESVRANEPIYVKDSEELKGEFPEEYEICQRFRMHNVLGVPYRNCSFGFMVVKNPRKYADRYEVLNLMCYVLTHEIIDSERKRAACRNAEPDVPQTYNQVNIKLLGEYQICTKGLCFSAEDVLSDQIKFVIAYLAMNPDRCISTKELNDVYFNKDGETDWRYCICRFKTKYSAAHPEHDKYPLIIGSKCGYRFNPELSVVTDIDSSRNYLKIIEDTTDMSTKLELLCKWPGQFKGVFLQNTALDCSWVSERRTAWDIDYQKYVGELITLLMEHFEYDSAEKYADSVLTMYPANGELYYAKLVAEMKRRDLNALGGTLQLAARNLEKEERAVLFTKVCVNYDMPQNHHAMIMQRLGLTKEDVKGF
ncbi:MAG: hypothetical protein HUJ83_10045 [Veillonella sp.]|nr:hypothetical protein [Veillonella sp.]